MWLLRTNRWAIGTGEVATPEDAQEVCSAIRTRLGELYSPQLADGVRVLYGGSVKAGNVAGLMEMPTLMEDLWVGLALTQMSSSPSSGTVCTPFRSSDPITNNRTREKSWPSY